MEPTEPVGERAPPPVSSPPPSERAFSGSVQEPMELLNMFGAGMDSTAPAASCEPAQQPPLSTNTDLLGIFSSPAQSDSQPAMVHQQLNGAAGSDDFVKPKLDLDPSAVSDAALATALLGSQAESGIATDLPIDALSQLKPKIAKLDLDPDATSEAAVAAALGGSSDVAMGSDMPIDAPDSGGSPTTLVKPKRNPDTAATSRPAPEQDLRSATRDAESVVSPAVVPEATSPVGSPQWLQQRRKALGIKTIGGTPRLDSTGNGFDDAPPTDIPRAVATEAQSANAKTSEDAAPVCLIAQIDDKITVETAGLEVLQSIGSAPVAVISVAGLYRTGKSYFLNQLSLSKEGFTIGHDTESCTRGIWVYLVPSSQWQHPTVPGCRLLLLDTEGLSSTDQDETYDVKIFSLGILLSSLFVYNSMGVIDEGAIDKLFLVGELAKNICTSTKLSSQSSEEAREDDNSSSVESDLAEFFPPFVPSLLNSD